MKRYFIAAVGVVCAAGVFTGSAVASPLPAGPLVGTVMGESDIHSFIQLSDEVGIDWMVMDAAQAGLGPAGAFAYLYQIENTSNLSEVNLLTVSTSAGSGSGILSAGDLSLDDLDLDTGFHRAHDASVDAILSGEEEGLRFRDVGSTAMIDSARDNVTWHLSQTLKIGQESQTLYFVHRQGPVYGHAGVSPFAWATTAPGSDQVPVPAIPEPASLALLILGGLIMLPRIGGSKRQVRQHN